jgi:hypothetical protein
MEPTQLWNLTPRGSFAPLIWLDSVKRADCSLPHGCESLSEHALSVPFVLQIRLVGGTAF